MEGNTETLFLSFIRVSFHPCESFSSPPTLSQQYCVPLSTTLKCGVGSHISLNCPQCRDYETTRLRRFLSKNIPSCGSFCPSSLWQKCLHSRAMRPFPRREDAQKSSAIRDILFRQSPYPELTLLKAYVAFVLKLSDFADILRQLLDVFLSAGADTLKTGLDDSSKYTIPLVF